MLKKEPIVISVQELKVIKLIALNNTMEEIAVTMFISPQTARTHRSNLTKKCELPMHCIIYWLAKANVI